MVVAEIAGGERRWSLGCGFCDEDATRLIRKFDNADDDDDDDEEEEEMDGIDGIGKDDDPVSAGFISTSVSVAAIVLRSAISRIALRNGESGGG